MKKTTLHFYFIFLTVLALSPFQDSFSAEDSLEVKQWLDQANQAIKSQEYNKANGLINKASGIAKEQQFWAYYASCDWLRSKALYNQGQFKGSINVAEKAIDHLEDKINKPVRIKALLFNSISKSYYYLNQSEKAVKYLKEGMKILKKVKGEDSPQVARIQINLGVMKARMGYYNQALHHYRQAISKFKRQPAINHQMLGLLNNNLGDLYQASGMDYQAIQYFKRSIEHHQQVETNEKLNLSYPYSNLAVAFSNLDQNRKSLRYFKKTIAIREQFMKPTHPQLVDEYSMLGNCYKKLGSLDKAGDYLRYSLELTKKASNSNALVTKNIYQSLGDLANDRGLQDSALYCYLRGLRVLSTKAPNSLFDRAEAHKKTGLLHLGMGNRDSALHYANNIQKLAEATTKSSISSPLKRFHQGNYIIEASFLKARVFEQKYRGHPRGKHHLKKAFLLYKSCDTLIREIGLKPDKEWDQIKFRKKVFKVYEGAIRSCLTLAEITEDPKEQNQYFREAFRFSEKNKAQVLKQGIIKNKAIGFAGIPDSLINLEKKLHAKLSRIEKGILEADTSTTKKLLSQKHQQIRKALDTLPDYFKTNHPGYFRLKYTHNTVPILKLQERLRKRKANMVSFFAGDSNLTLFLLNGHEVKVQQIPVKEGFYEKFQQYHHLLKQKNTEQKFKRLSYSLYRQILAPYESFLEQNSKIIFIPDGILATIPFEALLSERPGDKTLKKWDFLLKTYAISYYPSASLWVEFADKKTDGSKNTPALAAFAPKFGGAISEKSFNDSVSPIALRTRNFRNVSLPGALREVKSIGTFLPGAIYAGKKATETRFKEAAQDFTFLHLATHAVIENANPLESRLLFSRNDSLKNNDDGRLFAYELYDLKLNAEMAVLSACNTGSGKIHKGEGMMNLARAFHYAGVPNTMMTLWPVADRSSGQLMKLFYKNFNQGYNQSKALRQAKLEYLKKTGEKGMHPYYWAGFVMNSHSHPLHKTGGNYGPEAYIIGVFIAIAVLIIAYMLIIRFRKVS